MQPVNPFEYGGVVGPDAFCNRHQEQADLTRAAENGDRLFVYAERRMGKTSLVKRGLAALDRDARAQEPSPSGPHACPLRPCRR